MNDMLQDADYYEILAEELVNELKYNTKIN